MFLVGNIAPVSNISVNNASIEDNEISLNAFILGDSGLAYKNCSYKIEDDRMYIKAYSVVTSVFYKYGSIDINIKGDFVNINKLYLEDQNQKVIIFDRKV